MLQTGAIQTEELQKLAMTTADALHVAGEILVKVGEVIGVATIGVITKELLQNNIIGILF